MKELQQCCIIYYWFDKIYYKEFVLRYSQNIHVIHALVEIECLTIGHNYIP